MPNNTLFLCRLGMIIVLLSRLSVHGAVTPFLQQSFFFDWNKPGQPVPIPVTEQCEVIHIVWERSTATGPNPTAPYYLQVYTSTYTMPFIIPVGDVLSYDWAVPFYPGTLYQICMFDKFGNTGGCQSTYTVIPPTNVSTPTCTNVTFAPPLGVSAVVDNGPISQFGWVDQCTDISLTPTNGTPPYTLTVAPALHPPYNITSLDMKAINWTLSLSWGSPFFISLVDANGSMWSNGPLHAAGGGTTECLAGNVTSGSSHETKLAVTVGSGIGGLVVGLLLGTLGAYLLLKRHFKKQSRTSRFVDLASGSGTPPSQALMFEDASRPAYRPLPTVSSTGALNQRSNTSSYRTDHVSSQYEVEPWRPDEQGRTERDAQPPSSTYISSAMAHQSLAVSPPLAGPSSANQLYVLHHDSNTPPVTIYHQEGTQIVELPPRYPAYASSQSEAVSEGRSVSDSHGRSDAATNDITGNPLLHQPRQPNRARKSPRS